MKRAHFSPETDWQLQTAKARFSELFRKARTEGPQRVTRSGKEAIVILPAEEYEKLTKKAPKQKSLWQILRESPLVGLELDLERDKDPGRDIEL